MTSKSYHQYQERTGKLESSGDYSIKSKLGYLGKYQMGVGALIDTHYYKGNKNGSLKNLWDGAWTGKDGVYSVQDFLNNPKAQDKAFREYNGIQWGYLIDGDELGEYIGKEINGITITPAGMLAGAHLVGHGGMATYLRSNGKEIPVDNNGVPIEYRVKEFEDDYDVSEITGIPHRDYAGEKRLNEYEKIKPKYTPKELSKMSKFEFFCKENDINKDQEKFRENVKQMRKNNGQKVSGTPTGFISPLSNTNSNASNSQNNFAKKEPSKLMHIGGIAVDTDNVSIYGKKWNDLGDEDKKAFFEGLKTGAITKEGEKRAKLREENWTKKFNIGNPETDKGHWARSRCRRKGSEELSLRGTTQLH